MSRITHLLAALLLGSLSLTACVTPADARPTRGVKKICPDGTEVPFKKPCPAPDPDPEPEPEPGVTPSLFVTDVSVNEGAGTVTVTITKQGASADPSLFSYSTSPSSATASADYTTTSGSSSISASATTKQITVPIIDDTEDESNETFIFNISAGTNSQISDAAATVTIVDNDDATPSLSIADVTTSESGGLVTIVVTRSSASTNPTTFTYSTSSGTATASQDYTLKSGSGTVPAENLTTTFTVGPILEDLIDESAETFTVTIVPTGNGTCSDCTATVTINDNDETPIPPLGSDDIVSPEIGGVNIASNFDVNTTLKAAWGTGVIPASNGADPVGAFRFICGAGQLAYDDPIVSPGQPGKAHLHQFYGNTEVDAYSSFESLRASGDSTCNFMGNGTAANRSAYWMPAVLDGKGNVVMPDYIQVYYKREPASDIACTERNECITIPNRWKFISGFNMKTGQQGSNPGHFTCVGTHNTWGAENEAMSLVNLTTCPVGTQFEMVVASPRCWNGTELDSTDHMSHLTGMVRNASTNYVTKCPTTHPYYAPQFTISAFYTVGPSDDPALWKLSSDAMFPSMKRGATLHFDYFEAWDNTVKQMWIDGCINSHLNCSGGDLGNGKQLKGAAQPTYGWKNPTHLVPIPTPPTATTNHIQNKVAAEGDSISVYWGGGYPGIYDNNSASVSVCGLAVGGSGISSVSNRIGGVLECNGEVVTLLIGANGLNSSTQTTAQWLTKVWAYTDALRAKGYKVAVGTVLPQYWPDNPSFEVEFNRRRNDEANPAIRAAVGTHIDAVIDFAADPVMGPDAAARNTALYRDGVHPTDGNQAGTGGQNKLAAIYGPVVDALIATP
jgi:hypothetical protein